MRRPAQPACAPSECGWCPSSPLVACVGPVQRNCVPSRCDLCPWRRCGVPARLACPPSCSYSVVQWTCSPGLPLICLTCLSYCRVTQIMSSIASAESVRPTWVHPGCDWCLWHLLLSYGVPVQLGSVLFRCCGCWLCLGGSGSVGRAVAVPPCCVYNVLCCQWSISLADLVAPWVWMVLVASAVILRCADSSGFSAVQMLWVLVVPGWFR